MTYGMKESGKRVLATLLTIAMLFGLIPGNVLQTSAATENHPDVFTVTVTDGVDPIQGASVRLYNDTLAFDYTYQTDEKGEAAFEEFTVLQEQGQEIVCSFSVEKDGYSAGSGEVNSTADGWTGNKTVQLTALPKDIPSDAYSIKGYSGVYDGQAHAAVVEAGDFTVKYSDDNVTFTDTVPHITEVGSKTVYVQLSKEGYNPIVKDVVLAVTAAERTDFKFTQPSPTDLDYAEDLTFENAATSTQEPQAVVYTITAGTDVADIDAATGMLSFKKAGSVEVKAVMPASTNYKEAEALYRVTVNHLSRGGSFKFATTAPSVITYGADNNLFNNVAVNAEGDGTVSYSIVSQERDGAMVNDVASIDEATGEIKIKSAGKITVKAAVSKGDFYEGAEASYELEIERASQTGFAFSLDSLEIAYGEEKKNAASGGEGSGAVSYKILSGSEFVEIDANGNIHAKEIGEATVRAVKAQDSGYKEAEAYCTVKVIKAEQKEFAYETPSHEVEYGIESLQLAVKGVQSLGEVTYSVVEGADIADVDASTGLVTFKSGKIGNVKIIAVSPEDEYYKQAQAETVILMSQLEGTALCTIKETDIGLNGWYKSDVQIVPEEGYQVGTSDSFDGTWNDRIIVSTEGTTAAQTVYVRHKDTGAISKAIEIPEFKMDKSAPEALAISYPEPSLPEQIVDFFDKQASKYIKHKYYQETIDVVIEAEDTVSGIDHFVYYAGETAVTVLKDQMTIENGKAFYEFEIAPQFKGQVSFMAYDEAGNYTACNMIEETVLVVDSIAPGVTVHFSEDMNTESVCHTTSITATISITEENFYAEDVDITLQTLEEGETEFKEEEVSIEFVKQGDTNEYIGTILFEKDAEYKFDIAYTDKSGNVFDKYEEVYFIIDRTPAKISVEYDKSDLKNEKYYPTEKELTFVIEEQNFVASNVELNIQATDLTGADVELPEDYAEYLRNQDNWTHVGSTHTAKIKLTEDAWYQIDMTCTDLAGIAQATPIAESFVIDKSAPVEGTITYAEKNLFQKIADKLFFDDTVEVTLTAKDAVAEILEFTYTYAVQDSASKINEGRADVVIPQEDLVFETDAQGKTTGVVTATFEIPAQFKGNVFFHAKNMAEQSAKFQDIENLLVVDSLAPGIVIAYDNNESVYEDYYQNVRTASIWINEANFEAEDVVVEKGTTAQLQEENIYTYEIQQVSFVQNSNPPFESELEEEDWMVAELPFTESGHYSLKVSCEDKSGNSSSIEDSFTIDTISPVVIVKHRNNEVSNEKYFKSERPVTIEIIEHNFDAKNIEVLLTAKNFHGEDVKVTDYQAHLENGDSWTHDGDKHTAEITFTEDAAYTFDIKFADKSGRYNESVDYADSVVPTEFIIDKTAAVVEVSYDNMNAQNETYFDADRTVTIRVTEENFDEGTVYITAEQQLNSETSYTAMSLDAFKQNSSNPNLYEMEITFNQDADYKFDISYTDKAGNPTQYIKQGATVEGYEADWFCVDKTAPEIVVSYINSNGEKVSAPLDGTYFTENQSIEIIIDEHNFSASDVELGFEVTNAAGEAIEHATEESYIQFVKEDTSWSRTGDESKIVLDLETKANYIISLNYKDLAGNALKESYEDSFCVDLTAPTTYEAKYSLVDEENGIENIVDNLISFLQKFGFNFYNSKIEVTISASDETAGIGYFEYYCNIEDGASVETNTAIPLTRIDADKIEYDGSMATATFEIEPQYRGCVTFIAYDKAGNQKVETTDRRIVVDNEAPIIEVTFNDKNQYEKGYFKNSRTAIIKITEANFWAEDVEISIEKTMNDGTKVIEEAKTSYTRNGNEYTAEITFTDDADYVLSVNYTDKSGNVAEEFKSEKFTVDNIAPAVSISYNNNECLNGNQFKKDRTVYITIQEHNFNAKGVNLVINATDANGNSVKVLDGGKKFSGQQYWTKSQTDPDVHTTVFTLNKELHYSLSLEYTDLAGNKNNGVDTKNSKAPWKFTIDKTKPTASIKIGTDKFTWSESVNGTKWNKFTDADDITFGLWTNTAVKVAVNNQDKLSGIDVIEYFRSMNPLTLDEVKESNQWIKVDKSKRNFDFMVNPDEQFIVYVHVADKAGNELYLSSDGVILDKTLPSVEKIAPQVTLKPVEQPVNGIYRTDVLVDVEVIDPIVEGVYSGLKSITYEVYNNSESEDNPTQTGTLFTFGEKMPHKDQLIQSYTKEGCIKVDRVKNNSNEVLVKVIAEDNSGNIKTEICELKIDITDPKIEVSYSNNVADKERYFKEDRTAEIVITERNFDPSDVKIDISNTEGVIPRVSDWSKSAGSGNGDGTTWKAHITYSVDGDYTFDMSYTDLAGNECDGVHYAGGTVAGDAFTIDKTIPTIEVTYDNNSAMNENYYKDTRVATISIHEHNFDEERVVITMTASDDGAAVNLPGVNGWTSHDDYNVATITYSNDALYTFDIEFMDMAGNYAEEFAEHEFYVDKTMPVLEITGVENNVAYSGDVLPVVTYSDTNFDASTVDIVLTGANRGPVDKDGVFANSAQGGSFSFKNFPEEKAVDDIYTLSAQLTDMAGNVTEQTVVFSVNRFGSNYQFGKGMEDLMGTYMQEPQDIVIHEINPTKLHNIQITLFKDSETIILEEGKDYRIDVTGGEGQWYQYTYTIFKSNFMEDAVYRIAIYSEDEAGNVSENTLDTKNCNINFGVDNTDPLLVVTNLESNVTYPLPMLTVMMTSSDNLLLNEIKVYLDDYEKVYASWNVEEIAEILAQNGEFTFDIPGDSDEAHKVKIVAVDAAGNESVQEFTDFYVTTSLWVRFVHNKPVFYGSIFSAAAVTGGLFWFILGRKKKKEDETPTA